MFTPEESTAPCKQEMTFSELEKQPLPKAELDALPPPPAQKTKNQNRIPKLLKLTSVQILLYSLLIVLQLVQEPTERIPFWLWFFCIWAWIFNIAVSTWRLGKEQGFAEAEAAAAAAAAAKDATQSSEPSGPSE